MKTLFAEPVPQNDRIRNRNTNTIPFEVVDPGHRQIVPVSEDVQILPADSPVIIISDNWIKAGRVARTVGIYSAKLAGQIIGIGLVISGHVLYYLLLIVLAVVRGLSEVLGQRLGICQADRTPKSRTRQRNPAVNIRTDVQASGSADVNIFTNIQIN